VQSGFNGCDRATEMAAKEASAVDRPDRLTRPNIPTSLPPEVTDELPIGQMRSPGCVKQARNFFERNRAAARRWWEDRIGRRWPSDAVHDSHPRALIDGGDPLFIEPSYETPWGPHIEPRDFSRWGRLEDTGSIRSN